LAWPSRWPWLSSGCPFDRALGDVLGQKIETEPLWLSFGARRSKRQRGVGWGSAGVRWERYGCGCGCPFDSALEGFGVWG
jgi:hypothetical protein